MATRHRSDHIPRRRLPAGAAAVALALLASGCSGWFPDRPEGRVSADQVEYPNINNAPDRPSELKSPQQQQAMEQELQNLGADHVKTAQKKIDTQNRRQ